MNFIVSLSRMIVMIEKPSFRADPVAIGCNAVETSVFVALSPDLTSGLHFSRDDDISTGLLAFVIYLTITEPRNLEISRSTPLITP